MQLSLFPRDFVPIVESAGVALPAHLLMPDCPEGLDRLVMHGGDGSGSILEANDAVPGVLGDDWHPRPPLLQ